jgi:ABC-type nitrate/sulfonate/bicarbonate transport system ATPase subunit
VTGGASEASAAPPRVLQPGAPARAAVLQLRDVHRSFGSTEVIRNLTLEVGDGEFVAIVGPSGCGKTTLLNLMSGYDAPTRGTVARGKPARMVYQSDGLFPWRTVGENVAIGLHETLDPRARERELAAMLATISMTAFRDHYPHQLSGGMRQRVELGRALAGGNGLLLMDEPFSALDYITRLRMRAELVRMLEERPRTVVLVTHDIEEAAQLADRVIVLSDRPARVRRELRVDLPRTRSLTDPEVVKAVHVVLNEMGLEGPVR